LSSALILFVPERTLARLNLKEFLNDYGKFIGITFLISSAFLLVTLFSYLSRQVTIWRATNKTKRNILNEINNLGFHEKAVLREFSLNGKDILQLPLDNDTVVGLQNKRIIYQVSNTGFTYAYGVYFTYAITEFAKKNLTPEMIDLPTNPDEQEIERLKDERPTWAKDKSRFGR